ncbi:alpha/beta fold hydrolase [Nonomuraea sp. NPDC003707]
MSQNITPPLGRRYEVGGRQLFLDRGGTGWSGPTRLPRTADELYDLLRVAGVPGPYVLVGHSLGGLHARRCAQLHPDEVAGLVALDILYEEWDAYVPEPFRLTQAQALDETVTEIPAELVEGARALLNGMFASWPADIREALVARHLDPAAFADGMRERANLADLAASVSRGENRVLENASHSWIHIEGADVVLKGIQDLIEKV